MHGEKSSQLPSRRPQSDPQASQVQSTMQGSRWGVYLCLHCFWAKGRHENNPNP